MVLASKQSRGPAVVVNMMWCVCCFSILTKGKRSHVLIYWLYYNDSGPFFVFRSCCLSFIRPVSKPQCQCHWFQLLSSDIYVMGLWEILIHKSRSKKKKKTLVTPSSWRGSCRLAAAFAGSRSQSSVTVSLPDSHTDVSTASYHSSSVGRLSKTLTHRPLAWSLVRHTEAILGKSQTNCL